MKHIITACFYQKQNCLQTKHLILKSLCFKLHTAECLGMCFPICSVDVWTLIVRKDSDGMLFATYVRNKGVLCASARSPQNRLTALWAVGRFLPWWASSPAWQRRLDVIKVYTLSAVWGCVKWALLLPKAPTVIVYLHRRPCEISKTGSLHRPAYSSCGVIYLHCTAFPDVFFPPLCFYMPFCYCWRLVRKSHP